MLTARVDPGPPASGAGREPLAALSRPNPAPLPITLARLACALPAHWRLCAHGALLWPSLVGSEGITSTSRVGRCSGCAWILLERSGSRVVSARPTLPKHASSLWAPMRPCCSLWVPPRAPQPATWRSGASSQAGRVAPASWMGLDGSGLSPDPELQAPPLGGGMVRGGICNSFVN